ncbi:MAG: DUF2812 domain-containing protein [Eubacteriaceae bacterium]|nr:DUF2812 domain-containing protein [Eubacteriaceae bacterium]
MKTKELVRKYRHIGAHRIGENESWFADMAASGLHLSKLNKIYAYFTRAEPAKTLYRIDFIHPNSATEPDQEEIYLENGWKHVCTIKDMAVYSSPASRKAPEPHSDLAEQPHSLSGIRRFYRNAGIACIAYYAAIVFLIYMNPLPSQGLASKLVSKGSITLLLIGAHLIFGIVFAIEPVVHLRAVIISLGNGKSIDHNADWRKRERYEKAKKGALACIALLVVAFNYKSSAASFEANIPPGLAGAMPISLSEIEAGAALERRTDIGATGIDFQNRVSQSWQPLAPISMQICEHIEVKSEMPEIYSDYDAGLYCSIYKARFLWLSKLVAHELANANINQAGFSDQYAAGLAQMSLDELYIGHQAMQCDIIARKGKIVAILRYDGEQNPLVVINAAIGIFSWEGFAEIAR